MDLWPDWPCETVIVMEKTQKKDVRVYFNWHMHFNLYPGCRYSNLDPPPQNCHQ